MRRVHLSIRGHVQGVSFRYHARRRAESLSLAGWVRNCRDGSVEAVAQGADDAVAAFVEWAHRGPSGAAVERVETHDEQPDGALHGFRILSG